ncbi:RodZ domain-containing protein [Rheinheimera texasensis]|uniref:RodZ domain-containing protein n=1 Tax=Rheinheimera texasensis TaxID=306205 RepID=UPI0004E165AA|nr:RodZ domain-containing protein [Rheinheimera texasensis]
MTSAVGFADAGALLRQRREALGLSLEQAAAQLNLKAVVIRQLESGQFDPQVAPTFIRGYLRHYVRLLKLNEADLLAKFDQQLATLPQVSATMHSFSNKASRDAAESRFMLATYFLLVLLIGLFLIWFWQTHMLNEQPVAMLPESDNTVLRSQPAQTAVVIKPSDSVLSTPAAETVVTNEMTGPAVTTSVLNDPQQSVASADLPPADSAVVVDANSNQPVPETQSMATAPVTVTDAAVAPVAAAGELANAGANSAGPASTTETSAEPTGLQPEVTAAGTLTLQLQFSAQCWVAVTDGSGKRLAYSMQNGGQSLTLTGAAPLQVTFGDPMAVTASLSGKTLDLSGYKQGQVVRLTLTGSE